ncbi:MAG: hypothetical protein UZ12_BCD005002555 [Bacteroidetes bacterium OLB12]|nr:MAG: hypothetical protein UZ12_BCD005002555 [Bacteroidetes bacterium OLB12]HNR73323.1 hypothetical protein [Cyclobacteriaceae bacterium]
MFSKTVVPIFLSIFVIACNDENLKIRETYSFELDGKYELLETASVEPVDLNFDGLFSNNILLEANQIENKERFYLELESIRYDWEPVFYDQRMFLWSPLPNVITSSEGVYLRTEYGYTALLAKYQFDPMKNKVDVLGNLGGGSVDAVLRTSPDTLKINYRQFFFTSNGWEELSLVSLYKRF